MSDYISREAAVKKATKYGLGGIIMDFSIEITHWKPMPEPPEEQNEP